jgi:multidrug efflux pump subunit AcrB
VVNALNAQNLMLPSGSAKFGDREYLVALNTSPDVISAFNDLPIKTVNGSVIFMRDVAHVHDGYAVQTNIVRKDGLRAALMVILKTAGASTIDIVNRVKAQLAHMKPGFPPGFDVQELFDQSIFVESAVQGVIKETLIAACLTATMILIFLGSWRSTLIVAVSIPLSILVSVMALDALGYTINVMTLGGLSLAVGILVDDATVELENVHRNLALDRSKPLTRAILDGARQIATPAFISTLSICIAFVSVVFLTGPAQYLFTPLALAVVFAMMASYVLSRSLVPILMRVFLRPEVNHYRSSTGADSQDKHFRWGVRPFESLSVPNERLHTTFIWRFHEGFIEQFERFRSGYRTALSWALNHPVVMVVAFLSFFGLSTCLLPFIGRDFFPTVDAGQLRLHVRTPAGTRIEQAERTFQQVEDYIRQVIPSQELQLILDNIGLPVGGVNLAFGDSATIGSTDGEVLVALTQHHKTPVADIVRRLRRDLLGKFPGVVFYFQPADMVSQILNFGLPAPIDVQVTGPGKFGRENFQIAEEITHRLREVPGAVDVTLKQVLDAPQFTINVDRQGATLLGMSESDVANSLLVSLSSSSQTSPNYWVNPKNGVNYLVAVQTPQYQLDSLNALQNTPVDSSSQTSPQLLSNLLKSTVRSTSPLVIDDYNVQPAFDVQAAAQDRDLGGVSDDVQKIVGEIAKSGKLPPASRIVVRGQADSMNAAFGELTLGILFALALVYFLLVVNFQSWLDPLIIITALPGAFSGILWMLFASHTTVSVPSLIGTIMCIGVATSNAILLLTFANDQRRTKSATAREAALAAGYTRLRPVLMTALAMILGMIPTSLDINNQNAPLGRAVIGGLLIATATTLFFVPVMYSLLRRRPLKTVDQEDAELLFREDEPERILAEHQAHRGLEQ